MSRIRFYKYQATGNDFILLLPHQEKDWSTLAQKLCHRHLGIGADGLILVQPFEEGVKITIFNPDGSEAEISGNGLRCIAKFAYDQKIIQDKSLKIKTKAGTKEALLLIEQGEVRKVRVNMGTPKFQPKEIPLSQDLPTPILDYPLEVAGKKLPLSILSLGNPHAVLFIEQSPQTFPLQEIGPLIENHPLFPQRTNFQVAHILSPNLIEARVWERGTGETPSCGSGACAIATTASLKKLTHHQVDIKFEGGVLRVEVGEEVWLEGGVEGVFWGEVGL